MRDAFYVRLSTIPLVCRFIILPSPKYETGKLVESGPKHIRGYSKMFSKYAGIILGFTSYKTIGYLQFKGL